MLRKTAVTEPVKGRKSWRKTLLAGLVAVACWLLGTLTATATGAGGNIVADKFKVETRDLTGVTAYGEEYHSIDHTRYFRSTLPTEALNHLPNEGGAADPRPWDERVSDYFDRFGGEPALADVKVIVINHLEKAMTITGVWSVVEAREKPQYVTSVRPVPTGGSSTPLVMFDLSRQRSPGVISCGAGFECNIPSKRLSKQEKVSFFAIENVRIKPEGEYAFLATPQDAPGLISWHIEVAYLIDGEKAPRTVIVRNMHDKPFRGAGYAETKQTYEFVLDENNGDFYLIDAQDRAVEGDDSGDISEKESAGRQDESPASEGSEGELVEVPDDGEVG